MIKQTNEYHFEKTKLFPAPPSVHVLCVYVSKHNSLVNHFSIYLESGPLEKMKSVWILCMCPSIVLQMMDLNINMRRHRLRLLNWLYYANSAKGTHRLFLLFFGFFLKFIYIYLFFFVGQRFDSVIEIASSHSYQLKMKTHKISYLYIRA